MKTLNINTLEGWNAYARENNIKELIRRGILPTEENYQALLQEMQQVIDRIEMINPPMVAVSR